MSNCQHASVMQLVTFYNTEVSVCADCGKALDEQPK